MYIKSMEEGIAVNQLNQFSEVADGQQGAVIHPNSLQQVAELGLEHENLTQSSTLPSCVLQKPANS